MEDAMYERNRLQNELQELKESIDKYKVAIENAKEHIKKFKKKTRVIKDVNKAKDQRSISSSNQRSRLFKGRPSLMTIKDSVCEDLASEI